MRSVLMSCRVVANIRYSSSICERDQVAVVTDGGVVQFEENASKGSQRGVKEMALSGGKSRAFADFTLKESKVLTLHHTSLLI